MRTMLLALKKSLKPTTVDIDVADADARKTRALTTLTQCDRHACKEGKQPTALGASG